MTGETTARRATAAPTAVMAEGEAAADCAVQDQVTIRMPADGAYLSVLRTATAGLAARLDFTLDEIEDLRIAVDELAFALIGDERSGAPLTLRFFAAEGLVEIDGECAGNGSTPELGQLARTIVDVITDEHEIMDDGESCKFRLVKRTRD